MGEPEDKEQPHRFTEPPRLDPEKIKLRDISQDVFALTGLNPEQIKEYARLQEEALKTYEEAGKIYYGESKKTI